MITKIKFSDVWTKQDMAKIADEYWHMTIDKIKHRKLIKRGYAPSTIAKRKRFGLQTGFVDLFGSTKYSKKQWRMLYQGKVIVNDNRTATIAMKRVDAARLFRFHQKRYPELRKL